MLQLGEPSQYHHYATAICCQHIRVSSAGTPGVRSQQHAVYSIDFPCMVCAEHTTKFVPLHAVLGTLHAPQSDLASQQQQACKQGVVQPLEMRCMLLHSSLAVRIRHIQWKKLLNSNSMMTTHLVQSYGACHCCSSHHSAGNSNRSHHYNSEAGLCTC